MTRFPGLLIIGFPFALVTLFAEGTTPLPAPLEALYLGACLAISALYLADIPRTIRRAIAERTRTIAETEEIYRRTALVEFETAAQRAWMEGWPVEPRYPDAPAARRAWIWMED
jgi:hypothetical protein